MYNLGLNPTVRNTGTLISNSLDQYYNHRVIDMRRITNTCCSCNGSFTYPYHHFAYFDTRRLTYWLGNGLTGESKVLDSEGKCTTCDLLPLTTDLRAQDAAIIHYHRDDNPVISNCIPHPSHYDIEYDTFMVSDQNAGSDFYEYFKIRAKQYCILDTKLNEYYSLQYSKLNNQIFFNKVSNADDSTAIKYDNGIYININSVKYKITLVNKVLVVDQINFHLETHDDFYVKDVDFSIKYDSSVKDESKDPLDASFLQYYKLSIDPSTSEIIFIKDILSQRNMYETPYQKIIHNKNVTASHISNIIMRDKFGLDYQDFSTSIGSKQGVAINPYISMNLNGYIYDFKLDAKNQLGDIAEDENIFVAIYDENFAKIVDFNITELYTIEFNFDLAWLEIQRANGTFSDISYLGSGDAKIKHRFNLNKSKKVFIVFRHLNDNGSMIPSVTHEIIKQYRELRFKFRPKDKAPVSEKIEEFAKGVIEFRTGINLANLRKINEAVFNGDHCNPNTNMKKFNSNIDNPYYAYHHGCLGFHYIEKGMHKYVLFVNKFADQIYHDKFSRITSAVNIDISVLHTVRGSSKQFDVKRIDDNFINDLCKNYSITGYVRFISPNLPIRFEFQDNYRYEFIPFLQTKINSWITNGEHSNFDECKTGIYVNGLHNKTNPTQIRYHTLDRFREEHVFAGNNTKYGSYTGIHKYTMFRFICSTSLQYDISYALKGKLGRLFFPGYKTFCGHGVYPSCGALSSYAYYQVAINYTLTSASGSVSGIAYKSYYTNRCLYSTLSDFHDEKIAQAKEDMLKDSQNLGTPHTLTIHSTSGKPYYPDYNTTFYFEIYYWIFRANTYSYYIGNTSTVFKVNDYLNEQYLKKNEVDEVRNENVSKIEVFSSQETQQAMIPNKIRIFATKYSDKPKYNNKDYYQGRRYALGGTNEYMVFEKDFNIEFFMSHNTVERYLIINANDFKYPGTGATHNDYMITTVEFEYYTIPRGFKKLRKIPTQPNKFYDEYWNEIIVSDDKKYVAYPTKTMILPRIEFKLDNYGAVEGKVDTRYVHKENDKTNKHNYFNRDNDTKNKMRFVDNHSYMKLYSNTTLPQHSINVANVEFHTNKIYRG